VAFTVSVTAPSISWTAYLKVIVLTGAAEAGGANGGTDAFNAPSFSFTPTFSGSFIALGEHTPGNNLTAVASNTFLDNTANGTASPNFADGYYSGTVTASSAVTLGATTPTGAWTTYSAYEVQNSGGWAIDGSSPAQATSGSSPVTSASFTPPAGAVLVAVLGYPPTAAAQSPAISDTSGLGLTWTQQVINQGTNHGLVAIWTATIPGAAASGAMPHTGGHQWRHQFRHYQQWLPPSPPVTATPPVATLPLVAQAAPAPGFGQPCPAVISRNSLADAPVLTTGPPVIGEAAATPAWGQPNAALTARSSLQDFATPVTPAPAVIPAAATRGWGIPGPALISAAPFIPAAAPTQATPPPVVAAQQPPPVPPGPAVISRNSLADAPVLTTAPPVVVMATAVTQYGRPQAAVITGNPAAPAVAAVVTPASVVVAQQVKAAAAQPPVVLRSSLADAPVLTTPRPVVVMTQVRPPPTTTVITGAPQPPPPPPPFTIGQLTAATAATGYLGAGDKAASALTGGTAPLGAITATDV
jgi:hypothetical protein